ncbi:MAG: aldehyde dehydrogenase, partial [Spirochaetota bacterium]|nr:aldehyde dehydrogenase [Spirochaetota bacterium]
MDSDIKSTLAKQRAYFDSGATRDVSFRLDRLKRLRQALIDHESEILDALYKDFRKPHNESHGTEIGLAITELNYFISHLRKWTKRKTVPTFLFNFYTRSYIYHEPYGLALLITPWNYPFLLTIPPLIGAIAAGNCVVLKPSERSPNSSNVIKSILDSVFPEEHVKVYLGDSVISQTLLRENWDYLFFIGGIRVGKIIMEAAAKNITPLTLELGGKSPCIVHHDADIAKAARRIVWGKMLNGGQSCAAPDYVLAHKKIWGKLLEAMKGELLTFYGNNPEDSGDFCRMIDDQHYQRLKRFLDNGDIVLGGQSNDKTRYIAPTILKHISMDDPVMSEEIFGPILPVLDYETLDDVAGIVKKNPNPFALYIFTNSPSVERELIERIPFGAGCVNDTMIQFASSTVPLGGVGASGIGSYRGKASFEAFSHRKGILKKSNLFDLPFRYPPYT